MADRHTSIVDSALDLVGGTPVVRLNRVSEGLDCELVAKLEYFNPGGSVKDRIAARMVLDAEKSGRLKAGDTIIEPTSGNTGIGLAMTSAVKGYNCIITLPEKMSREKISVLRALGANVMRTPTEYGFDHPDSHIGLAEKIRKQDPTHNHVLDQYSNPGNPDAHSEGTAQEILQQCGGKLDMVVIGAGTGGTISGVAKALKQALPDIIVVGVDPDGSILHDTTAQVKGYAVEGIGYDFIPKVCDRDLVDRWEVVNDQDAFYNARRLIREEGLLCGGSSGSALTGALRAAKQLKKGQRCLIILPDSIRNYLTKFVNDDWMQSNGFTAPAGGTETTTRPTPKEVPATPVPRVFGIAAAAFLAGAMIGASLIRNA